MNHLVHECYLKVTAVIICSNNIFKRKRKETSKIILKKGFIQDPEVFFNCVTLHPCPLIFAIETAYLRNEMTPFSISFNLSCLKRVIISDGFQLRTT